MWLILCLALPRAVFRPVVPSWAGNRGASGHGAGEYDVSATAVGVVEADELLGPDRVRKDDVVIAMASSGLHSDGYSLARYSNT